MSNYLKFHEFHLNKLLNSNNYDSLYEYMEFNNIELEDLSESVWQKIKDGASSLGTSTKQLAQAIKIKMLGSKLKKTLINKASIEADAITKINQLENRKEEYQAKGLNDRIEALDNSIADIRKISEVKANSLSDMADSIIEQINTIADTSESTYVQNNAQLVKAKAKYEASKKMLDWVAFGEKETLKKDLENKEIVISTLEDKISKEEQTMKDERTE